MLCFIYLTPEHVKLQVEQSAEPVGECIVVKQYFFVLDLYIMVGFFSDLVELDFVQNHWITCIITENYCHSEKTHHIRLGTSKIYGHEFDR